MLNVIFQLNSENHSFPDNIEYVYINFSLVVEWKIYSWKLSKHFRYTLYKHVSTDKTTTSVQLFKCKLFQEFTQQNQHMR
jgi:hypothetical protein